MPAATITAIVLRSVNYRDNDRMLTLLSPQLGRVEVLSRGCRRPKSPLLCASDLFCTGEYVLFTQGDRSLLTGCTLKDSFYPLRLDLPRLSCGVYMLNLCEAAAQPGEESPELFLLLLKSLHRLSYGPEARRGLVSGFLLHYATLLGYKPRLNHCVHCGKSLMDEAPLHFDCEAGGLVCNNCATKSSLPITGRQVNWLRTVIKEGAEASGQFPGDDAPFESLRCFVETRLEKPIKSSVMLDIS
jgi:DNA repair protein RecO (recombination protein O)